MASRPIVFDQTIGHIARVTYKSQPLKWPKISVEHWIKLLFSIAQQQSQSQLFRK